MVKLSRLALKITISSLSFMFLFCQNKSTKINNEGLVKLSNADNLQDFLFEKDICYFAKHEDFRKISPEKIWYRDEFTNTLIEGFILPDSLQIFQSEETKKDNSIKRWYKYKHSILETTRIKVDSLNFDFNTISIDYAASEEVYQKDNFLLLINQPMGWSGLSNKFRFIQLFDLSDKKCYEFWIDINSCDTQSKEQH